MASNPYAQIGAHAQIDGQAGPGRLLVEIAPLDREGEGIAPPPRLLRGDLAGHRIDHGDHGGVVVEVGFGRFDRDICGEIDDRFHLIGFVEHLEEDVVAHQVQGEGEGPADEAVEGDEDEDVA